LFELPVVSCQLSERALDAFGGAGAEGVDAAAEEAVGADGDGVREGEVDVDGRFGHEFDAVAASLQVGDGGGVGATVDKGVDSFAVDAGYLDGGLGAESVVDDVADDLGDGGQDLAAAR